MADVIVGYAEIINGLVAQYPLSVYQIRALYPNVSWPDVPDAAALAEYNLYPVYETPYVGTTRLRGNEVVVEDSPVYDEAQNRWEQSWSVILLTRGFRDNCIKNQSWHKVDGWKANT
jgi:hypothetical protein